MKIPEKKDEGKNVDNATWDQNVMSNITRAEMLEYFRWELEQLHNNSDEYLTFGDLVKRIDTLINKLKEPTIPEQVTEEEK